MDKHLFGITGYKETGTYPADKLGMFQESSIQGVYTIAANLQDNPPSSVLNSAVVITPLRAFEFFVKDGQLLVTVHQKEESSCE